MWIFVTAEIGKKCKHYLKNSPPFCLIAFCMQFPFIHPISQAVHVQTQLQPQYPLLLRPPFPYPCHILFLNLCGRDICSCDACVPLCLGVQVRTCRVQVELHFFIVYQWKVTLDGWSREAPKVTPGNRAHLRGLWEGVQRQPLSRAEGKREGGMGRACLF